MKEIRLTGIPTGERKTRQDYYIEKPEEIMFNSFVTEAMNINGFTELLYYPQYFERTIRDDYETRVVKTISATTLMIETKDKSTGRKKWETIGHSWGISDAKLEELGFQKWKESDYDYKIPNYKIEIEILNKETFKEVEKWIAAQNTTR